MAARLQVDVKRRSLGFGTGPLECRDLGVIPASGLMETAPDDSAISNQHRSDHRIRAGPAGGLQRKPASYAEITSIFRTALHHARQLAHSRRPSFLTANGIISSTRS